MPTSGASRGFFPFVCMPHGPRYLVVELHEGREERVQGRHDGGGHVVAAFEGHPGHLQTRGGELAIRWDGPGKPVLMTGPAQTVFEGEWRVEA